MKIAVTLTTYNRPELAFDLLQQICKQASIMEYNLEIFIIDDGSSEDKCPITRYDLMELPFPVSMYKSELNHGKAGHWKIINIAFDWLRHRDFDYAIHLQDDLELEYHFIPSLIDRFRAIEDLKKVCLNYVLEESRIGVQCWTPGQPERVNYEGFDLWKVGWVELHFIANRLFFDALGWRVGKPRHPFGENKSIRSSGVGNYISNKLYEQNLGMYQVVKSLAKHGHIPSLMNPEERVKNPLRSI